MIKILFISAMREEVADVKCLLSNNYNTTDNIRFCKDGLEVYVVNSGIGKLNASITMSKMLSSGIEFDYVLHTGLAASPQKEVNIGDIVVGSAFFQHDMDLTAFGSKVGECDDSPYKLMYSSSEDIANIPLANSFITFVVSNPSYFNRESKVRIGSIASGDQFIADDSKKKFILDSFNPFAIDMESYAVAYTCYEYDVLSKLLVLRYISDTGDSSAKQEFDCSKVYQPEKMAKLFIDFMESLRS